MAKVKELNDMNFQDMIDDGLMLVDFWAPWCGPCRMIAPVVEQLSEELDGKVKFYKVNVDDNPLTAGKYNIMSIPTLLILNEGQVVDSIIGAVPKQRIEEKLKVHLQ